MSLSQRWIAGIVLLSLTIYIGYFVERQHFTHLFLSYTGFFLTYLFILKNAAQNDISFWFKVSIILRGCLLFSIPNLSDDIYRFIWDGRLINSGINPFNYKPSYFFENQLFTNNINLELYQKLNSKNYFTVYPPVCQAIFFLSTWLSPKSIYGSILIIKSFLIACDIGTIFLLKSYFLNHKYKQNLLLYILNPLIIIELCGNAHFEAAMIFFFLLSISFFKNNKIPLSALWMSLSIASKMLPILFLPFFINKDNWKKSFYFFSLIGIFLILFFSPLYNALFISNIRSSLGLYFQKFEFNASIYYLVREVGFWIKGYNWGPQITGYLSLCVLGGIFFIFIKNYASQKAFSFENIAKNALFAITIYLLFASTVHPWYLTIPFTLSIFNNYRFPLVWTYFGFLTYIHYSYPQPTENYGLITLEYLAVIGFGLYEIFYKKNNIFNHKNIGHL